MRKLFRARADASNLPYGIESDIGLPRTRFLYESIKRRRRHHKTVEQTPHLPPQNTPFPPHSWAELTLLLRAKKGF